MFDLTPTAIGVFDSGFGGVSVLRYAQKQLPKESFIYYGDNLNAPYGCRSEDEIRSLTLTACRNLYKRGLKALLLACNTATAASINLLKEEFPIPVIGTEPDILNAEADLADGMILMMSTEATTRLPRYLKLREKLIDPARVVDIPCPVGFVLKIESGVFAKGSYDELLEQVLGGFKEKLISGIVLGCTHYPLIQTHISEYAVKHFKTAPKFYDGGKTAVRNLQMLLAQNNLLNSTGNGSVEFMTSGNMVVYQPLFRMLLASPEFD